MLLSSDPVQKKRTECVQALHQSAAQIVAALSGGGTFFLSDILATPGGSRTLIEASIPYSHESISNYIGRVPEHFCGQRTARMLAMTAFYNARKVLRSERLRQQGYIDIKRASPKKVDISHEVDDISESAIIRSFDFIEPADLGEFDAYKHVIGIACTATLATDRPKAGDHRVHIAIQTLQQTSQFSLKLQKNARSRSEEERLVADMILNAVETTRQDARQCEMMIEESESEGLGRSTLISGLSENYPLRETIPLKLKPEEQVLGRRVVASPLLVDLFFGKISAVLWMNEGVQHLVSIEEEFPSDYPFNTNAEFTQAIFPGAFNPMHQGHLEMLNIAEQYLQEKIVLEISVQNVDKPPFDYIELEQRLSQIDKMKPGQAVWLTQTPLFLDKAALFQGTTFVVGADTLRRLADLRFYQENVHKLHELLRSIAYYNCRFLVFARQSKTGIESMDTLDMPDMLRSLCDDVPASVFTMDISSSDLRRKEI